MVTYQLVEQGDEGENVLFDCEVKGVAVFEVDGYYVTLLSADEQRLSVADRPTFHRASYVLNRK